MVSLEDRYTSHIIWTQQVVFENIYVYKYGCAITVSEKRGHGFERVGRLCLEGGKEGRNILKFLSKDGVSNSITISLGPAVLVENLCPGTPSRASCLTVIGVALVLCPLN